jgi:hypothetical protein
MKAEGVRPSEIADWLGIGRASVYRCWVGRLAVTGQQRKANGHRVQGFGLSGVPQLLGSGLIDMP